MATYKVGYFVGSLASTSINRLLAKALVRLAPPELVMSEIAIKDLPLYSYDYDADYPPVARALQAGDRRCRRGAVRDARVQPLDPRRPEERHRLGQPALGQELLRAQAFGRHRHFAGRDRHRGGAAEPARRAVLLQLAADEPVEAYIQFKPGLITADGEVTDDGTKQFLQNYMTELHAFIVRVLTVLPRNA